MKKLFNFLSSIKLAVIIILSLAILLAVGTFYEATYGTAMAQKHVYHSIYANLIMIFLIINLVCSALDRYPWKKHHIGFVVTHSGIIIIILGAFITQKRGLDGILYLPVDSSAQHFSVEETELRVYQTLRGQPVLSLLNHPVDFDLRPPEKKTYDFPLVDGDRLQILSYAHRGLKQVQVTANPDHQIHPVLKFQLHNAQSNVQEWIGLSPQLPPYFDLGPAIVALLEGKEFPPLPKPRNEIALLFSSEFYKSQSKLKYAIYSEHKGQKPVKVGTVKSGEEIETGWMGLKFKVQEFIPSALIQVNYKNILPDTPEDSPNLSSAVQIKIGNKTTWIELDSPREIQGDKLNYFVSFVRKRYNLGFQLFLKKFKMTHYEGSQMPKSYESSVLIEGESQPITISMNEPLKHNGFTLYQSSFEQNERGEPIASILSVNYDPGRAVKYIGSIMLVCGIGIMFYIKPRWTRKKT